nr:MAG TPA: hypothetical protein [Caudoviricetes sp.]
MWWYSIDNFSDNEQWILPLKTWDENGNISDKPSTKRRTNNTFVNSGLNNSVVSKGQNGIYSNIAQSEYVSTLPPYITCDMYKRIA